MIRGRGEQFLPPDIAFFLDFDGTLVEIAEHPDAVVLQSSTRLALGRLDTVLEGAIAIVSGPGPAVSKCGSRSGRVAS